MPCRVSQTWMRRSLPPEASSRPSDDAATHKTSASRAWRAAMSSLRLDSPRLRDRASSTAALAGFGQRGRSVLTFWPVSVSCCSRPLSLLPEKHQFRASQRQTDVTGPRCPFSTTARRAQASPSKSSRSIRVKARCDRASRCSRSLSFKSSSSESDAAARCSAT